MRQMQKYAPLSHLTVYRYENNLKKKNYPAYNEPQPGDGLLMYRERLTEIVCPGKNTNGKSHLKYYTKDDISKTIKCRCEECHCVIPTTFNNFFKVFPPKLKYPSEKLEGQKLSFMDDPPYTDYSEFLSKLRHPEITYLEKKTNKRLTVNRERYYDIDPTYCYCRYQVPNWVGGGLN